eukprot:3126378-Lingulodinium_polyedra.AAC.1
MVPSLKFGMPAIESGCTMQISDGNLEDVQLGLKSIQAAPMPSPKTDGNSSESSGAASSHRCDLVQLGNAQPASCSDAVVVTVPGIKKAPPMQPSPKK